MVVNVLRKKKYCSYDERKIGGSKRKEGKKTSYIVSLQGRDEHIRGREKSSIMKGVKRFHVKKRRKGVMDG